MDFGWGARARARSKKKVPEKSRDYENGGMHCARGAVQKQEIGDKQAQPPYPWGSIDANDLVVGAVSQDVRLQGFQIFVPE